LVKNSQTAALASFGTLVHAVEGEVDDLGQIVLLTDKVVEFFDLEHVVDNGGSVQVVLLRFFWTKVLDKVDNSHLLFGLDFSDDFWLMVGIDECQKFVKDLGDRLLIDVLQKIFDDS